MPPPRQQQRAALPQGALERIRNNLERCQRAIAGASQRVGRDPKEVLLLAVTKYVGCDAVRVLLDLGVRDFGESTIQGIATKVEELGKHEGLRWHLTGHLQRNKVARACELCHAIHSVDSVRLLEELSAVSRRRSLQVPELYVELNLTGETRKTGLAESDLAGLLEWIRADEGLAARTKGLMAMAAYSSDPEASRPTFRRLRELRDSLRNRGLLSGAGLSMGMSGDFEVAVEEGATVVRVGSMLFENLA